MGNPATNRKLSPEKICALVVIVAAILSIYFPFWRAFIASEDFGEVSHLKITTQGDGNLVFDFSLPNWENSVHLPREHIEIDELDNQGTYAKAVWIIVNDSSADAHIKSVVYGQTPKGWRQVHQSIPLGYGKFYLIGSVMFYRDVAGVCHVLPGNFGGDEQRKHACRDYSTSHSAK